VAAAERRQYHDFILPAWSLFHQRKYGFGRRSLSNSPKIKSNWYANNKRFWGPVPILKSADKFGLGSAMKSSRPGRSGHDLYHCGNGVEEREQARLGYSEIAREAAF